MKVQNKEGWIDRDIYLMLEQIKPSLLTINFSD